MPWNSYTYSTLQYNWKVPRSKHISFFRTGWSTSRIIKDDLKSLRRTALSPSLQSIRSSCAVARNSAVALDKACQKKNTLVSGTEDLEVSVQDSLIRVFVKWVLTKHVYWKKSWYGWILRISCSSPKPPTPYSHTANSIHFATCQIPENVSIFRFQSETERYESIQESWKGWRQASETSCCRALRISDVTCSLYSFKWASLDLDNLDNCQNNKFDPISEASLHQWCENRT